MKREGNKFNNHKEDSLKNLKGEISFIRHLIQFLEKSEAKLEEYYKANDAYNFNRTKRLILQIQNKIKEALG